MAAVKSTGNKITEHALATILRRHRVRGWRRHLALRGKPDFAFRTERVLVFVDGCFWHGCKSHLRLPVSNKSYWTTKISRNQSRDKLTTRALRQKGWRVVRLWEHELRNETRVLRKIESALEINKKSL